jgi:hypothetical protein
MEYKDSLYNASVMRLGIKHDPARIVTTGSVHAY